MENIKVKRSILFQISYFRKSEVKKLRVVNFLANNTMYKQQNLITTIGELKFIVRIYKGSSATDIVRNEKESPLPYLL